MCKLQPQIEGRNLFNVFVINRLNSISMKRYFVIMTVLLLAIVSCEKDSVSGLEIYLLTDYQKKSSSFEIIAGSEILSKNPIIYYSEIVSYDSTDHYFQIETTKAQELNQKTWSVQGTAFSLTINKSIIYSGYFIPSYSSLGIDWITIDPLSIDSKIRVSLGYPVDWNPLKDRDPRNDVRIIDLLIKDNKLKQ
jgi:hypothetical protein